MEEDKKSLNNIYIGYKKNSDSYLYFLNLISLVTLPYWIFKLELEILLIVFLVFIFYYSGIPELKNYKILGISIIAFDILMFLANDSEINCNMIYFIIIGIIELESFKFTFLKDYFRIYHIALKTLIFFCKFLFFSYRDLNSTLKFDRFVFKSLFFTLTLQLVLKIIKIHTEEHKSLSNEINKFKTICETYPEGVFLCKVRKHNKTGKSNISDIIYLNSIAQEILKISPSCSEKESITQLTNFEMVNDIDNKNTTKVNFLQFILDSPISANETQYGLIKCSMTAQQSVVKINDIKLQESTEENKLEFSYVNKTIAIEKLSDEKFQIRNKIYNNLKSKFLLTISHELNNPLNGLIYYCDKIMTEDDIFKRSTFNQKIKKLKFAIKFFIKNLNLNSKIILKEKIKVELSIVNFSQVLNKVMNRFVPFLDNKKIKYTTNLNILTNIVIKTDYNYFKFFLKNVFMYVCHKIEEKKTLKLETQIIPEKNILKLNFFKQNTNKFIYQYTNNVSDTPISNSIKIGDSVQTEGMLREILFSLAEKLNIKVTVNENLSEFILSFEIEFLNLENIYEQDDLNELSPESTSKKEDNIKILMRVFSVDGNQSILESNNCIDSNETMQKSKNLNNYVKINKEYQNFKKLDPNLDEKGLRKIERFKNEVEWHNSARVMQIEETNKTSSNDQNTNQNLETVLYTNRNFTKSKISPSKQIRNHSSNLITKKIGDLNQLSDNSNNNLSNSHNKRIPALRAVSRSSLVDNNENPNNVNIKEESRIISVETSNKVKETAKVCCRDILVVDDEMFNISGIKNLLKNFKLVPDTCENGFLAVQKVNECFSKKCCGSVYKLILMDVMMPVMDGFEASRKIQSIYEENQQSDLVIIIISAHDSQNVKDRIKDIKFIKEFVEKPVKKSKIQDLLKKFYL